MLHLLRNSLYGAHRMLQYSVPGIADVQSVCTQYAGDLMAEPMKPALTIEYSIEMGRYRI